MEFIIFSIDADILTGFLRARLAANTARITSATNVVRPRKSDDDVVAPWQVLKPARSIESKISEIRRLDKFIDVQAESVLRAGGNQDFKNLFALYNGLVQLRTLAEYAASESTVPGILRALDAQFQSGLNEVRDFLKTTSFDEATLLFGEASGKVISRAALGRIGQDEYIGAVAQFGDRTAVLAGLTGTEIFTLAASRLTESDDVVIDLSKMTEALTLDNIVAFINQELHAIPKLDSNGDPVLDEQGNVERKYQSSVAVEEVAPDRFAIKFRLKNSENFSLSAPQTAPTLILAGSFKPTGTDALSQGTLRTLEGLDSGNPTVLQNNVIAALAPGFTPPKTDGDEPVELVVAETRATATAVDSQGNVYVVGQTKGDLDGQFNHATGQDVFLTKYDSVGNLIFSRLLGASADASPFALVIDSADNVIVAGRTTDNLTATAIIDSVDSFVTKFDSGGVELFTHQQQTAATDAAVALTVDSNDDIYVGGFVTGVLNSTATAGGGLDGYVVKLSGSTGVQTLSYQFGGAANEKVAALAIAADGNLLVASVENDHAVLRKLNPTDMANPLFTVDLGPLNGGSISGIAVDGSDIYLAGTTANNALTGGTATIVNGFSGGTDGFLTKIADSGTSAAAVFTTYLGTADTDRITGLGVNGGVVFVSGETTGTFAGENKRGTQDGFAAGISGVDGTLNFVHQFGGGAGSSTSGGLAVSPQGASVLSILGLPTGSLDRTETRTIVSQTSVRAGQSFLLSINDGPERRITIEANDTFKTIASKINRLSFRFIEAKSITTPEKGPQLSIEALNGAQIDIIADRNMAGLLAGLGIDASKIIATPPVDEDAAEMRGGTFGFELTGNLNLKDKQSAGRARSQISAALATIQRIFRNLTRDPALTAALAGAPRGPVPPQLLKELSNYQAALARIQVF